MQEQVLALLAGGATMRQVHDDTGVTPQRIHSFRAHDPQWGVRVDAALMAGRDEGLEHGRHSTYRFGGCRCPECRAAKRNRALPVVKAQNPEPVKAASCDDVPPAEVPTDAELARARRVSLLRGQLIPFLDLLEQGETIKGALVQLGRDQYWLSKARKRVPEAEKKIKAAYGKGAYVRRQRQVPRIPGQDGVEQRAAHLVVAAVAAGKIMSEACRAGGATAPWVNLTYRKNEQFRTALSAAAAMHEHLDLEKWLQENSRGAGFVSKPRPPENGATR
ncbi:hypothetical protein ACN6LF_001819 [[Kitasatospora] papulosa]|uniref:hypothetical protein n=1 Tax=[Kitasatospora] papulosa TaxID=1464011 RepID=UPI0036A0F888